ncbi:hypothetical protein [Demequina subtropica]|uniref:hypothetical protein n=1 Tax=Demequina subtropica TaxID=1638989 RepID=UPI0007857F89|nr:hypothetical protein [Demequina subtropica]
MTEQPAPAPIPEAPEKKQNWFMRHKVLTGVGAVIVIAAAANMGGGEDTDTVEAEGTEVAVDATVEATEEVSADADATEEAEAPEETPTEEVVEEEAEPAFANGDYIVGTDIEPGQYRAGVEAGLFEVCMITQEGTDGDIIDIASTTEGHVIMTIKDATDSIVSFSGCEDITTTADANLSMVDELENSYYLVGTEIEAGRYRGTVDEEQLIAVGMISQYSAKNDIIDLNTGDSGNVIFDVVAKDGSVVSFQGLVDIEKVG